MTLIDPDFRPGTSPLLGWQHFQTAYVTNDLDRAVSIFADRYGVSDFNFLRNVPLPMGGHVSIALAWSGNMNIEIIHGSGSPTSLYEKHLPADFAIKHHHMGYLVPSENDWATLVAGIAAEEFEIVFSGSDPNGLDFIYIDAPEVGHYLEYVRPKQAWIDLFESLPRN